MSQEFNYIQGRYSDPVKTPAVRFNAPLIAFVQANASTPQTPQSVVTVPFLRGQLAGDLIVVAVGWADATSTISSVTDTKGNTYLLAAGVTRGTAVSQSVYYAKCCADALAGANVVTVTFSGAVPLPDVRIGEYAGLHKTSPLDVTASAVGTGSTADSGSIATTNANDVLVGASYANVATTGPGAGFTSRVLTATDSNILEDQVLTATGSQHATAPLASSGNWIMQMVSFKAA